MVIILDDRHCNKNLFPFTETRHTVDIRIGILTIREKWMQLVDNITIITETESNIEGAITIPANIIPTEANYKTILQAANQSHNLPASEEIKTFNYAWEIAALNDWAIRKDFALLTKNKTSAPIDPSNRCLGKNIFVEEGATIQCSIINGETGPVYIGKNAQVMEGCMIRGPFALGEGSVLKMGTKGYGGTSIGPYCIAGGEIKNSILFGFSNKAHDGYLGDSVIGEWCNLGAGTSNSNLKNSAGEINFTLGDNAIMAGNKAGLMMGDYSRAAINTSFNTGSIVGVCCNIFGREFPSRIIPNFTWGNQRYKFEKVLEDIQNWKKLKNQTVTETEITLLNKLYLNNPSNHA